MSYTARGRTRRVRAAIDAAHRRVRVTVPLDAGQARLGTGIIGVRYAGDEDTRPERLRLRAAPRTAHLDAGRPTISPDGRWRATGRLARSASGHVRVRLVVTPTGAPTCTLERKARVRDGRYRLDVPLPADVLLGIALRQGTVDSVTTYTGDLAHRIGGQTRALQVLAAR